MHADIFRLVFSVNIGELTKTESVVSSWVDEAIDCNCVVVRAHAECLADLHIVFVIRNRAPIARLLN